MNTSKLISKTGILLVTLAIMISALLLFAPVAYADTDGTELKVTDQPEKLVIQLGPEWAGAEFELKTDMGVFPQPVVVNAEGILTMELGGSKTYTLSALQSAAPAPTVTTGDAELSAEESADAEETQQPEAPGESAPASTGEPDNAQPEGDTSDTGNGIPTLHLVLFIGGLGVSIAGLIFMRLRKKHKEFRDDHYTDDDDYFDE